MSHNLALPPTKSTILVFLTWLLLLPVSSGSCADNSRDVMSRIWIHELVFAVFFFFFFFFYVLCCFLLYSCTQCTSRLIMGEYLVGIASVTAKGGGWEEEEGMVSVAVVLFSCSWIGTTVFVWYNSAESRWECRLQHCHHHPQFPHTIFLLRLYRR